MSNNSRIFGLTAGDLGVQLFEVAPGELDPKLASEREAPRLGWFPPAGPEVSAEYRAFWTDSLSFGSTYVTPRFSSRSAGTAIAVQRRKAPSVQYDNWAGIGASSGDARYALHNLGRAYRRLGDRPRAVAYYRQALEVRELRCGQRHPLYELTLAHLAGQTQTI
ncbi:hypothetical protein A9K65_013840 [Mesorhizobium sp. WSM1497]|nr:hypothetical protein A9K65_013840 [Mesorhizobium sp. WSM1497]